MDDINPYESPQQLPPDVRHMTKRRVALVMAIALTPIATLFAGCVGCTVAATFVDISIQKGTDLRFWFSVVGFLSVATFAVLPAWFILRRLCFRI